MKLTCYQKVIKLGKDKLNEVLSSSRAKQARIQGELEIAKLQEQLATAEQEVTEICAEHPLNYHKLLSKLDQIALTERRINQFNVIIKQLFENDDD